MAQRRPGETAGGTREGTVGRKADGLKDHLGAARYVRLAVDREGAPCLGAPTVPTIIGPARFVGGVIGVGEFVVPSLGEPPERHV